jgi:hypothetical protein
MRRESDTHGPRKDEALKHELEGTLRGNRSSRAEEWRDPEPPADDDPTLHPRPGARDEPAAEQ